MRPSEGTSAWASSSYVWSRQSSAALPAAYFDAIVLARRRAREWPMAMLQFGFLQTDREAASGFHLPYRWTALTPLATPIALWGLPQRPRLSLLCIRRARGPREFVPTACDVEQERS